MTDQEKDIKGIIKNSANKQSNAPVVKEELIGRYDRKKTISLIRYVLQKMEDKKTPYVPLHYTLIALYNSLELLSDQEPRVMTLEEASSRLGEPVWVEEKAPDAVYCEVLFDVDGKAFNLTFGNIEFGGFLTGHSLFSVEPYGRDFRFWTSRPTDEQRKAVKWE